MLCHDYCEEMQGIICLDTLKLELLNEANQMRKRAYLLPRDSMVHKLPMASNGEHQFAMYREEEQENKMYFVNSETKRIQNFWCIPSFSEILSLDAQIPEFQALNNKKLYQFDLGHPGECDDIGRPLLSEFAENKQILLLKSSVVCSSTNSSFSSPNGCPSAF